MLGAGIVGAPLLGYWQDRNIDAELSTNETHIHLLAEQEQKSVFGSYR